MRRIDRLKSEARQAATARGHTLGNFASDRYGASASCKVCGKGVQVTPKPQPNEIDIGGEAVAVGCSK